VTLCEIAGVLNGLGSGSSEPSRQAAFELSASIGRPASVRSLLNSIQSSHRQLEDIARRSFRHTNHFDKIVFLENSGDASFRLALHLWRPPYTSEEVEDEQIHSHRNDFWSTVLFGELQSWEFVRSERGEQYHETLYRPSRTRAGAKLNEYSPLGHARLRHTDIKQWKVGATYYLHHDKIHRIAISQFATATLLLKGPHVAGSTSLFSTAAWHSQRVRLRRFDVTQLIERFDFIRSNLPW